jgi:hypothetical protein
VDYRELLAWVEKLPAGEKNDLFARLVLGEDSSLATVILRRFLEQREASLGHAEKPIKRRTVCQLFDAAEEYGQNASASNHRKRPWRKHADHLSTASPSQAQKANSRISMSSRQGQQLPRR